jgi:hypothetical protein
MLRRYTTSSFSGYSTCYRPRCYKSEGKAVACSLPRKRHISPASSFANPDARTVEHCIARYTSDSFLYTTFFTSRQTRSQGNFIWAFLACLRAWYAGYRKETSWTRGMSFHTNFNLCLFWQGCVCRGSPFPWCLSEYRRYNIACQL